MKGDWGLNILVMYPLIFRQVVLMKLDHEIPQRITSCMASPVHWIQNSCLKGHQVSQTTYLGVPTYGSALYRVVMLGVFEVLFSKAESAFTLLIFIKFPF